MMAGNCGDSMQLKSIVAFCGQPRKRLYTCGKLPSSLFIVVTSVHISGGKRITQALNNNEHPTELVKRN